MPTNMLRQRGKTATTQPPPGPRPSAPARRAVLKVGRHGIALALHDTQTADLLWRAMPIFSIAETWGAAIHFDTPVRAGRDRTARLNARPGDVCFWAEDERVMIVWGPTPISKDGEIRLMRPSNIWAHAVDDAAVLADIIPGTKIALERARET